MLFREDMGRNTRKWTAIETHDFLQSGAYHENKTLTQKIGDPRTKGKLSGTCFFLAQFVPTPWPVGMFPKFLLCGLKMLPDI